MQSFSGMYHDIFSIKRDNSNGMSSIWSYYNSQLLMFSPLISIRKERMFTELIV